mgnify:CR=1 FL=1
MNSRNLIKHLKDKGPADFVNSCLFDQYAWCFPTRSNDEYEDVQKAFSDVFDNQPSDIAVVGSGKYGYSLAPEKNFRPFQPDHDQSDPSDIDLVVISRPLFNSTWHHLRRADYNGAINARRYYQEDVFRRFIMVGTNDHNDTIYLRDLSVLLNNVRKTATTRFGISQTIKLRVYCSWSDAKAYHIWSAQRLGEKHGIQ